MGLSHEERRGIIFWAINNIVPLGRSLPDSKTYEKLAAFSEDLWPAFFNRQRNSAHWILGSSAGNDVTGRNYTPWDTAIATHINEWQADKPDFVNTFDPFDGFLDIESLLSDPYKAIYSIFAWSEQLCYGLRRYNDEFVKRYHDLSSLCSCIQGECFSIFMQEHIFTKAYLANQIFKVLYAQMWPDDKRDLVTSFLSGNNMHFDLGSAIKNDEIEDKRLLQMHHSMLKIHFSKRSEHKNQVKRLLVSLEIAGRHFHYGYEHAELIKKLETASWPVEDIAKVKDVINTFCQKKKEDIDVDKPIEALFYAPYEEQRYEDVSSNEK